MLRRIFPYFVCKTAALYIKLQTVLPVTFEQLTFSKTEAVEALPVKLIFYPLQSSKSRRSYTWNAYSGGIQVACALLYKQENGGDRSTGHWFSCLNDKQWATDIAHREWHAVVYTVLLLKRFMQDNTFRVHPDHELLDFVLCLSDVSTAL